MRGWGDALRRRALLRVMRLVGLDEEEGMRVNVKGKSGAKEDRGGALVFGAPCVVDGGSVMF